MMSILQKMFDSELCSAEGFTPGEHPKFRELSEKSKSYEEYFRKKLSEEGYKKMDEMAVANFTLGGLANSYYFKQGFKLAMMICHEVFADKMSFHIRHVTD